MKWAICVLLLAFISGSTQAKVEKIWAFGASGNRGSNQYINENGNLAGFELDVVKTVCAFAQKRCQFEIRDSKECGSSDGGEYVPGEGLLKHRFDGCMGRGITEERKEYFDFTLPYSISLSYFYVKIGNPLQFDENKVEGKRIAYLSGTYTNDACLKANGKEGYIIVVADGLDDALNKINNEEVDAFFAPRPVIEGIERASNQSYDCTMGGTGVMFNYGGGVGEWYDPTFELIKKVGVYKAICEAQERRHGGSVTCV